MNPPCFGALHETCPAVTSHLWPPGGKFPEAQEIASIGPMRLPLGRYFFCVRTYGAANWSPANLAARSGLCKYSSVAGQQANSNARMRVRNVFWFAWLCTPSQCFPPRTSACPAAAKLQAVCQRTTRQGMTKPFSLPVGVLCGILRSSRLHVSVPLQLVPAQELHLHGARCIVSFARPCDTPCGTSASGHAALGP